MVCLVKSKGQEQNLLATNARMVCLVESKGQEQEFFSRE